MSTIISSPAGSAVPTWLMPTRAVGHLTSIAAHAIMSAVLRCAASQAHRGLVGLDNRRLADIGLTRAELTSVRDALAEARTAAVLAQFPWNCSRMGA